MTESKAAPKRSSTPKTEAAAKRKDEGAAPDVDALRAERAKIIKEGDKASLKEAAAEQKAADAVDAKHVVKRDDEGAAEQQRSARKAKTTAAKLEEEGLVGPPVVAPIIEESLEGTFKLMRRDDFNLREIRNAEGRIEMPKAKAQKSSVRMGELSGLYLQGKNFPYPGEVIFDIRREDGQDHQRYSAWTDDGTFDVALPGVLGPGDWLIHAEALITQVGDGRDDHLPLIKVGEEQKLEVSA